MKRGARRVAFVVAIGATAACSLTVDLTGFSSGSERESPPLAEAGAVDAPVADAAPDVMLDTTPACAPRTVIDTPLANDLGTWTIRSFGNTGHPKVDAFSGVKAGVLLPFVDTTPIPVDAGDPDAGPTFYTPPERGRAIGGLWHPATVPLRAFDVSADVRVRCTKPSSCADGIAFAWLDTTAVPAANDGNIGGAYGFPPGVRGAAVLLDNYKNLETGDPDPLTMQVIALDATKPVGKYPWVLTSKATEFVDDWHSLTISLRGDVVVVQYDGAPWLTTRVPTWGTGLFGMSAATGGQTDAVAVRNVKASFYDCTP